MYRLIQLALPCVLLCLATNAFAVNRAGLVILHGDGTTVTVCVTFEEESISGLELLARSGLEYQTDVAGGLGNRVCAINGEGCYPPRDCFCESYGTPSYFWTYWTWRHDLNEWRFSGLGASHRQLSDGDMDAWVWDDSTPAGAFEAICLDCLGDIDGDGVCDEAEVANIAITGNSEGSNRILADSDGDGLLDGAEDSNANGARDIGETATRLADSDGDGFEDGLEVLFMGSDPLDPNDPGVPLVDADGDGLPAWLDPDDNNPDMDGDRHDDLYDAVFFGELAAAWDAQRTPPLGDVNGDGAVGNLDALIIQALFLGAVDHASPIFQQGGEGYDGFRFSNPSRNGQAGNLDALLIQAFFLEVVPTLPLR